AAGGTQLLLDMHHTERVPTVTRGQLPPRRFDDGFGANDFVTHAPLACGPLDDLVRGALEVAVDARLVARVPRARPLREVRERTGVGRRGVIGGVVLRTWLPRRPVHAR